MLTSKARRRLALKTSALGLLSTLVLFVGSLMIFYAPPASAAVPSIDVNYKCVGGSLAVDSTKVTISSSVETIDSNSTTHPTIKWTFSPITPVSTLPLPLSTVITVAGGDLTVASALPATLEGKSATDTKTPSAKPTTYTPPEMTATLTSVTATTGGTVTLTPATANTITITIAGQTTTCTLLGTGSPLSIPVGTGTGTGTDIVDYSCTSGTSTPQLVSIKVTLTPPTSAKTGEQFTIGWTGVYDTGDSLTAPTTGTLSPKIFPYASLSSTASLTPATGEGVITTSSGITLPTGTVNLKATVSAAGQVTVKPGKINFGSDTVTSTASQIACTVTNDSKLKTYTFTVGSGSSSPSPSPTPSETTTSPKPTQTRTVTVTKTPTSTTTTTHSSKTPKAGAETGGGGDAGPDGRLFVLTGSALILAAGVGGLMLRRRTITKG